MKAALAKYAKQILAIARVTFHELLREKVLWSAFVFALFCVGLSYAVSRLSFVENGRIALDFGLTAISLVGGLLSLVLGAGLIAKEVQNRTLYLVLTKSIARWQFVVGKLLGLLGIVTLNSLLMIVILMIVFLFSGGALSGALFKSLVLQITEFAVLASLACVFSVFSTTTLAAIFASAFWLIGHAMFDFRMVIDRTEVPWLRAVLGFVTNLLPDLTRFDIKAQVAHELPVTWAYTFTTFAYGATYVFFALVASCLIFSRRDL